MNLSSHIKIPSEALYIITTLNNNGYQAYAVGGCVRDSIIGRMPQDWDIATDAKPHEVKSLFDKTVDTGIKHGTVTVLANNQSFEVTTYRIEGEYTDNRRPESVEFTSSLTDDLSRRDFTVNAIAYHPSEGLKDPFKGLDDINNEMIRSVGNAGRRFREDALRMLRAVRFSAQLGFDIVEDTLQAIRGNSHLIKNISAERVRDELTRILISENPMKFILLYDTELLKHILPEFEICFNTEQKHPYHIYNVALHTLHAVTNIENDRILRWAMLLHDTGKPVTKTTDAGNIDHFYGHAAKSLEIARNVLKRFKFDNKSLDRICRLVEHHGRPIEPSCKSVRKAVRAVGDDIFMDLIKVQEADKKGQNPEKLDPFLKKLDEIKRLYTDIKQKQQCLSVKDLAVNGRDLISVGFEEGRQIGELLDRLLNAVIENPELNNRDALIEIARKFKN